MDDAHALGISGMSLQAQNRHQEALLVFGQFLDRHSNSDAAGFLMKFWHIPLWLYSYFLIESCPVCRMSLIPAAHLA